MGWNEWLKGCFILVIIVVGICLVVGINGWTDMTEERQRIFDALQRPADNYETFLYEQLEIDPLQKKGYTEDYHMQELYTRLRATMKSGG